MKACPPRVSVEPLVRRHGTVGGLARALGVHRRQVTRWRSGGLPLRSADRVAIALGLHPVEVWPDWYHLTEAAWAA